MKKRNAGAGGRVIVEDETTWTRNLYAYQIGPLAYQQQRQNGGPATINILTVVAEV